MKFLNNRLLTACVSLFAMGSSNLYAQTDYIITNDGAKVMGEVKTHNVDKVKFIVDGEKKTQKFNAQQIKEAYKAGHGTFRSIVIPMRSKPYFLQVLEDGKIKLYEYYKSSTSYGMPMGGYGSGGFGTMYNSTNKRWFAQKDGGEVVDVKSNGIWGSRKERKDNFLSMIKDNAHVAERYEKVDKFNFDFVQSLIVEYNKLSSKP